jgi:thiamine biosynthesis lipoprotein
LIRILCTFAISLLISACADNQEIVRLTGKAQGTTWNVSFWNTAEADPETIRQALVVELERIDLLLSNYRDDSHISSINQHSTLDAIEVDTELAYLIEEARKVHLASNGCYDLTINPLFSLWGFKGHSLTVPSEAEISNVMGRIGMDKLQLHEQHLQKKNPATHIDVSSIGQGYSVAKIADVLVKHGITNYLAEIGGELQTRGQKPGQQPWRVAIERPLPDAQGFQKVVTLDTTDAVAIMTSGTYRHYFDQDGKRYSHILDARSGKPVSHSTVSVTVIHPDPTLADAWSTALLCLGSDTGMPIANDQALAVLFIDQVNESIHESTSDAFKTMKNIRVE